MNEDTYRDKLNDLQLEVEELRAKLAAHQSTMGQLSDAAQSTKTDTIGRQVAINALWKALYEYEDKTEKQFQESEDLDVGDWIEHRIFVQNMNDIDRQTIFNLPSAQPERTCVNCGRTANNGGWYADGGTRCPIEEHYALPKDGFCHLWEKRNVTDDDYPERRADD